MFESGQLYNRGLCLRFRVVTVFFYLMEYITLFTIKKLLCLACGICLYCRLYSKIDSDWYCSDFLLVECILRDYLCRVGLVRN